MYIVPSRRGSGIGTQLTNSILTHPFFASVQRWMLRTTDAQRLYSRFGFKRVAQGDTLMVFDRTAESNIK
ncbi:MAG: GNAT family N-acetyltransferase [Pirellulaceae bacterium]|nr:GNAT family N-acetyltransferase [Pirellulaceae bacterium]